MRNLNWATSLSKFKFQWISSCRVFETSFEEFQLRFLVVTSENLYWWLFFVDRVLTPYSSYYPAWMSLCEFLGLTSILWKACLMLFHIIFFGITFDLYLSFHSADLNGIPLSTQMRKLKVFNVLGTRADHFTFI